MPIVPCQATARPLLSRLRRRHSGRLGHQRDNRMCAWMASAREGVLNNEPRVELSGIKVFGQDTVAAAGFRGGDDGGIPQRDSIQTVQFYRPSYQRGCLGDHAQPLEQDQLSKHHVLFLTKLR